MPGPMAGVKVVELAVWVAGPATSGLLADWGAEVVKIEAPPAGDPYRAFASGAFVDVPVAEGTARMLATPVDFGDHRPAPT